ncbi:IS21 family transposase [Glaciimonas sp. CA11.2]|uniref:IS21 family transposase n=1 Tax=unclassified Glaciimonas TaxID=2644401 RepID=UPI002AB4F604|nr:MULTISPECIES: IS21 family transposase [unclassified Glaciimonas]MDY7545062.1 IS21 family transposase [Glaciimonas sp. CA11.2]MDY7545482.1 IS21 family transposase [Glaciimonas sp. CA11.2]MDY7545618.1 IS21 family transposase [Glaciimonas sp. CA11.2]MDY7545804.1 IS21 family transposase [Glaciimonas sp. CA11.2]MDY7546140.1 IS21 family transposase [Glaciimonas sp. CA11.2]
MPVQRITMRKIKDVLRLKLDAKLSHQQIAAALGISKGVVTKYVGLAAVAGLDWSAVQDVDDTELAHRLLVTPERTRDHVQPDYARLHHELRRKGMTLMLLWEEYRADYAQHQTYAYSQFCVNYRQFAKQLKRSMRQIHRAGEKLFIDYAGPTIGLTDGSRAHIFVAALGASSYTYACATPRETMADWLTSTARALRFFGGVPQLIVPDNPKAMIADANRYEPRSNDTVRDFARHYGTSILPARPRHPQDKAKAESAVQIVERWIMARLRHQQFSSVHEVDVAIAPLLSVLNDKPFQKLPGSRASAFAQLDVPALRPLPLQCYEMAHFKTVRVHNDYHVEIGRHHYSVPQALVGQVLEARMTATTVEILHRGQRVASHPRNSGEGGFTTDTLHMPVAHRAQLEWTPQRLIHWGQTIGTATAEAVTRLMAENRHPEHGYRACLGLLSLAKRYGKPRLEAGCMLALQLGACQYRHVRDILKNNRDRTPCAPVGDWVSPDHAHVRGPDYYQ